MEKISNPPPPWIDLPTDVTANILQRLGPVEILESAQKVCATWLRVCKDPSMWRVIYMIDPADMVPKKNNRVCRGKVDRSKCDNLDLCTVCCRAVNRSQGGLLDISIGSFCTGNLLNYISDRSSRLKRLTIAAFILEEGVILAAVKKWGELEELRLSYTPAPSINAQDIYTIGICCPLLKTVAFNNSDACTHLFPILAIVDDRRAEAIAENMPNLRHLQLNANAFTEKGLQAILDGCPYLESLDLREAIIYKMEEGDFRKRCSWIKDLTLPSESNWIKDRLPRIVSAPKPFY